VAHECDRPTERRADRTLLALAIARSKNDPLKSSAHCCRPTVKWHYSSIRKVAARVHWNAMLIGQSDFQLSVNLHSAFRIAVVVCCRKLGLQATCCFCSTQGKLDQLSNAHDGRRLYTVNHKNVTFYF